MLKTTLEKGDNKSNVPRIESGKKKDYKTDYSRNFKGELHIKNLYIYQVNNFDVNSFFYCYIREDYRYLWKIYGYNFSYLL